MSSYWSEELMSQRFCKALLSAAIITVFLSTLSTASAQDAPGDPLQAGFVTPPDSAKPRVWWHWTNGNVTKEGITKDLEWMKRVGIGGMQLSDVSSGSGQTVDPKINFFTPEWFDAVHHAAAEADRLGLEMSIFSSAGWSETGGPWVKPAQAMKKLVWSETDVQGPSSFHEMLTQPPSNNGTFGSLRGQGNVASRAGAETFYGDSAVIAFRTPDDELTMAELKPTVTTSGGDIRAAALMDDNLQTTATIAAPQNGGPAWVQYEFAQPIKARAVTLIAPGRGVPYGHIQVSDDGVHFRSIVELPGAEQYRAGIVKTYAFPETSAKFIRAEFTDAASQPADVINQTEPHPAGQYPISEFIVHTGARVDRWEEKAGFNFLYDYSVAATPAVPEASAIPSAGVIDLTSKMDKDGTLQWDVPAGKWTILRMGYSLTGSKNRPSTPAGSGLEVDKFSRKYVEDYFHGYVDPIAKALGPLLGKSLRYVTMDSFEGGIQNWTDDMIGEFARRGYDPTPYLPVLAGRVVGNSDVSDRFLWDFRRTLADLLAENHYGTMADLLKQKGIGIYAEAAGVSMEIMEDTLLNKSKVEIPMGEFWLGKMHPLPEYYVDVRGAASASHAYGKKLVATESFTGGGYDAPSAYKNMADYWFAQGVNRIVFHTSAQQPLDTKPGNTMVGTHMHRNITWAEQARPVMTYLARNSYMLQQGLFVADCAYLLDEGVPSSQPFWGAGLQPTPPAGYDYDCINADVLLNRLSVASDGRLVLPDGMSYRVLVLPQTVRMRPELLRKIRELALGGATILGPKPTSSPSLQGGYPQADADVQQLADDIWGDLDGISRNKHFYGKGLVVWGMSPEQVLADIHVAKDVEFAGSLDAAPVWIHRRAGDADIYFVANRNDQPQEIAARFRVDGKEPELWHPDTAAVDPAAYAIADGRTTIPLHLQDRESVFVVFRHAASAPTHTVPAINKTTLATIDGPWDISFPPNLGAPPKIQLPQLESWTANSDDGVKYFSGTATYTKTLHAPQEWFHPDSRILLNLGAVNDLATISLNGKPLGTLWKKPFELDVTGVLQPGDNQLEISVTNEWSNRLAGDRVVPPEKRVLPAPTGRPFGGPQPPSPSGLLGPVTVVAVSYP
jgi:alpha-L-rhamnosidase